jgi:hypothetical protein
MQRGNTAKARRVQRSITNENEILRNAPGVHEVQLHLRAEAKKETGVVDPNQAFDALNAIMRAEDPSAFESDIVELHRRKLKERAAL